ncbi:MAG TPA: CPBP family glutamic-type intramembrane protease [Chitinophagaceae bacterium]|nr:CPBP family glutamic-type intramembrane protease [Chitinophagaceae bacterium]
MKTIIGYINRYFYETDKGLLVLTSLFTALLIFFNYNYQIDDQISDFEFFWSRFAARYGIYVLAFAIPYLFCMLLTKQQFFVHGRFNQLLLIAPAIFSLKAGLSFTWPLSADAGMNHFWNIIVYWPFLLLLVGFILFFCWKIFDPHEPFYGTSTRQINWRPYGLMLLFMIPLVGAASLQTDFQLVYPKLNLVMDPGTGSPLSWWHKLVFELSYGSDFIGIELFFRGFLVLAFLKWAGKDAILPMACFYCTIHFGKPLGECISSYFGGILLGIVVANTKSIWGGLMVHLGIAWMMELAGYISGK